MSPCSDQIEAKTVNSQETDFSSLHPSVTKIELAGNSFTLLFPRWYLIQKATHLLYTQVLPIFSPILVFFRDTKNFDTLGTQYPQNHCMCGKVNIFLTDVELIHQEV